MIDSFVDLRDSSVSKESSICQLELESWSMFRKYNSSIIQAILAYVTCSPVEI